MNRKLVILAVTGAVVLAGCARMMAQQPKGEAMQTSTQAEAQRMEAPKPEPQKVAPQRPKPKSVPRTSQPRR